MSEVLIDSYPESNYLNTRDPIGDNYPNGELLLWQSVTGSGIDASRAVFYMKKTGSPAGLITAKIYAHSGTFGTSSIPTGPALATSEPISHNELTTSMALISFNFTGANRINLVNGTKYILALDGTGISATGVDVASAAVDISSPTHAGNMGYYDGVTYTPGSTVDVCFYLYGENTPTVTTSNADPIGSLKATANGTLNGTGGTTVDERGFVYGASTQPSPGNVAPGSSGYTSYVNDTGSFSIGAFTELISGLSSSSTYYVRAYAHNANGYSYGTEVQILTRNLTSVSFLNTDPTVMFRTIIDNGADLGSRVEYDGSSTELTGTTIDYDFNTATLLEGIMVCLSVAPSGWYWYVDPGTGIGYFRNTPATPTHTFVKGRHIKSFNLVMSIENLINTVYFTGGDTGAGENLFSLYTDADSVAEYGQRLNRRSDNRVTLQTTADAIGGGAVDEGNDEAYFTKVEILDETYDISTLKPGDTVAFAGFGNFIDSLVLQISNLRYTPQVATITIGSLPVRMTPGIEQIKRDLLALQTVANPDSPS